MGTACQVGGWNGIPAASATCSSASAGDAATTRSSWTKLRGHTHISLRPTPKCVRLAGELPGHRGRREGAAAAEPVRRHELHGRELGTRVAANQRRASAGERQQEPRQCRSSAGHARAHSTHLLLPTERATAAAAGWRRRITKTMAGSRGGGRLRGRGSGGGSAFLGADVRRSVGLTLWMMMTLARAPPDTAKVPPPRHFQPVRDLCEVNNALGLVEKSRATAKDQHSGTATRSGSSRHHRTRSTSMTSCSYRLMERFTDATGLHHACAPWSMVSALWTCWTCCCRAA
jgi:hypothetical protein